MDARDPAEIESRLRREYDAYLHTTNTKVGVFRDVILPEVRPLGHEPPHPAPSSRPRQLGRSRRGRTPA